MENTLRKQILILPGSCDHSARLGVANTLGLFMDLASEHAEYLGNGRAAMAEKSLFWLAVRTRACFYRRPALAESITAETWPAPPQKMHNDRYYLLTSGEEVLAEGKTEWAVLNTETGKIVSAADVYPPELVMPERTVCPGAFLRMAGRFDEEPELGSFRVGAMDIDYGGHMNNVAYVRALLNLFSTRELDAMQIRELEINYRMPCYEGDELSVRCRRRATDTLELAVLRRDGKAAALARILCGC